MGNHRTRVLFGLMLAAILVGAMYLDWRLEQLIPRGAIVLGITVLLVSTGTGEVLKLARSAGGNPSSLWTILPSTAIPVLLWLVNIPDGKMDGGMLVPVALAFVILVPPFVRESFRNDLSKALPNIAAAVLSVLYVGFLGSFLIQIRMQFGMPALTLFVVSAKVTDIGAYYVGRQIGRTKLAPRISPKKTVEGAIGGMILGIAVSVALALIFGLLSLGTAVLFGLIVSIASQLGDLSESVLKRSADLKDSANMPGFGGVLDMLDSVLFSAPLAYLLLLLFGVHPV